MYTIQIPEFCKIVYRQQILKNSPKLALIQISHRCRKFYNKFNRKKK